MTEHDLSEFEQYESPRGLRHCRVGVALGTLGAPNYGKLQTALAAQDRVSNAAIHRWCKARDIDMTIQSVITHRKGDCSCSKGAPTRALRAVS